MSCNRCATQVAEQMTSAGVPHSQTMATFSQPETAAAWELMPRCNSCKKWVSPRTGICNYSRCRRNGQQVTEPSDWPPQGYTITSASSRRPARNNAFDTAMANFGEHTDTSHLSQSEKLLLKRLARTDFASRLNEYSQEEHGVTLPGFENGMTPTNAERDAYTATYRNLLVSNTLSQQDENGYYVSTATDFGLQSIDEGFVVEEESVTRGRMEDLVIHVPLPGVALVESESGHTYLTTSNSCDCPDHRYRQRECRHMRGFANLQERIDDPSLFTGRITAAPNTSNEQDVEGYTNEEQELQRIDTEINQIEERIAQCQSEINALGSRDDTEQDIDELEAEIIQLEWERDELEEQARIETISQAVPQETEIAISEGQLQPQWANAFIERRQVEIQRLIAIEERRRAFQNYMETHESHTLSQEDFHGVMQLATRMSDRDIPYLTENVLDGNPSSFGIEVEWEGSGNRRVDRNFSRSGLEDAGWIVKEDGTVSGGEVTSPVSGGLTDTSTDWRNIEQALSHIIDDGGEISSDCGGHIHIGVDDIAEDLETHQTFLQLYGGYQKIMYKLASNIQGLNGAKRHRGEYWARPYNSSAIESVTSMSNMSQMTQMRSGYSRPKGLAFHRAGRSENATVEFRVWDGTLDKRRLQTAIMVSVGLKEAAKRIASNPEQYGHLIPPANAEPSPELFKSFLELYDNPDTQLRIAHMYQRALTSEEKVSYTNEQNEVSV